MTVVVYCATCDYFLKVAVQQEVGTHGCASCGHLMEVYIPQECGRPDHTHKPALDLLDGDDGD